MWGKYLKEKKKKWNPKKYLKNKKITYTLKIKNERDLKG